MYNKREAELAREASEVDTIPDLERAEIFDILEGYGISRGAAEPRKSTKLFLAPLSCLGSHMPQRRNLCSQTPAARLSTYPE